MRSEWTVRSDESRHHGAGDTRCRACGSDVEVPRFYDTRGHRYCAPECWENAADPRPGPHTQARARAELR